MSSPCVLYLDELELTIHKVFVPDYLSAIFQEADRIEERDEENELDICRYRALRESVLRRLDLMGCTATLCERRFLAWIDESKREQEEYIAEYSDDSDQWAQKELRALQRLTWSEWRQRVPTVLSTRFNFDPDDRPVDTIDEKMKDHEESWLWFDGYQSLVSLRAIIDACSGTETIALDLSGLIGGGWIPADLAICSNKNHVVAARGDPVGPTIILAEGRSDIAILKASIRRFHPDLTDFLTFLDHSEFKVDGGASYVVKFLKAFAAAKVPANIVAVFDNDTAGLSAYAEAVNVDLPSNMVCVHLPDIELAKSYPTIGPQGTHDVDINGKACGVELYLGRQHLMHDDALRPVLWTGYDQRANAYQGGVDNKRAVQESFLEAMMNSPTDLEGAYPEMKQLWQTILEGATRAAEVSQDNAGSQRAW